MLGIDEGGDAFLLLRLGDRMQRQRGSPPMPSALSSASELVEMTGTLTIGRLPSFMMDPLPNCRSTWLIALSSAFCLSVDTVMDSSLFFPLEPFKPRALPFCPSLTS